MKYLRNLLILSLPIILLIGCGTTRGVENPTVKEAIFLQHEVVNDPLFSKILLELENEDKIDWQDKSTDYIQDDLSSYSNNIEWLLSKYANLGTYDTNSVFLWRKFIPWSSTTAVTSPNCLNTKLNKWRLCRDKYSITNTLIHERVHSFGLIHPQYQTREANKCDASYIAGDLAEVLLLKKYGFDERKMDQPICPELVDKIDKYKLIKLIYEED